LTHARGSRRFPSGPLLLIVDRPKIHDLSFAGARALVEHAASTWVAKHSDVDSPFLLYYLPHNSTHLTQPLDARRGPFYYTKRSLRQGIANLTAVAGSSMHAMPLDLVGDSLVVHQPLSFLSAPPLSDKERLRGLEPNLNKKSLAALVIAAWRSAVLGEGAKKMICDSFRTTGLYPFDHAVLVGQMIEPPEAPARVDVDAENKATLSNIEAIARDTTLSYGERLAKATITAIRTPSGYNVLLRDAAAIELKWMRTKSGKKNTKRQRKQLRRMTADTGLTSIAEQSAKFAQSDAADAAKEDAIADLTKRLEKQEKVLAAAVRALEAAKKKRVAATGPAKKEASAAEKAKRRARNAANDRRLALKRRIRELRAKGGRGSAKPRHVKSGAKADEWRDDSEEVEQDGDVEDEAEEEDEDEDNDEDDDDDDEEEGDDDAKADDDDDDDDDDDEEEEKENAENVPPPKRKRRRQRSRRRVWRNNEEWMC
jgi:hypothetical protein